MTDSHKQLMYRFGLIILLVLAAYGNILNHGFVSDDNGIIVNNPLLEKLGNIPRFFLSEDKAFVLTGYYRPLTYVSFALDRAIWGLNPLGFNITNLVLHIIVALLFYAAVVALFQKERLALIAAVIFALHPIAGETVNFHAGGRNTLLSASFALLALLFYIKGKHLPTVVCFTCAIFSKEFALLLPLVFLFYDYRLQQKKVRFCVYTPYLIPIVCYLALRSLAVQQANFLDTFRFTKQLWMTPYLVVRYLLNMIYPFQLKVMYDESTNIYICILCLLVVILLAGFIFMFRRDKVLPFSAYWFLLFLLPVVNLIPIPGTTLIADRYAYFSSMGFALGLAAFISKGTRRAMTFVIVIICAAYTLTDFKQNDVWKDDPTFFTHVIKDAPEMSIGYLNLGLNYYAKGDMTNAEHYLAIACSKPDIPDSNLVGAASIFLYANKYDKAEAILLKALERMPDNPEPYLLLKFIYEQKGNKALADSYYAKARETIPAFEIELTRMAEDYYREGEKLITGRKYIRADNLLRRALLLKPDFVPALIAMGNVSIAQGYSGNAMQHLRKAIDLEPFNASAHYNLSGVYQKLGRVAEAQHEMNKSIELEADSKHKGY